MIPKPMVRNKEVAGLAVPERGSLCVACSNLHKLALSCLLHSCCLISAMGANSGGIHGGRISIYFFELSFNQAWIQLKNNNKDLMLFILTLYLHSALWMPNGTLYTCPFGRVFNLHKIALSCLLLNKRHGHQQRQNTQWEDISNFVFPIT